VDGGLVCRWFCREAESDLGVGRVWIELCDGWPSRQVEVYGDVWLWGDRAHPRYLADQPLNALELDEEHAIASEEFERVWARATASLVE
jgi:hypothetical protein